MYTIIYQVLSIVIGQVCGSIDINLIYKQWPAIVLPQWPATVLPATVITIIKENNGLWSVINVHIHCTQMV